MDDYETLSHTKWDCKYHVVFVPKRRRQVLYGEFLKGKSAVAVARSQGKDRNFTGEPFWARGYAVSTVGFELDEVRRYVREQDAADASGRF